MTGDMVFSLLEFSKNNSYYLLTGSDKAKIDQQIPNSILSRSKGYFTCMGNEFYENKKLIYKNDFIPSISLRNELLNIKIESKYPQKKKDYLEIRTGMVNFTTVGRSSSQKERDDYCDWDKENNERLGIVKRLEKKFQKLEFKIGGQISIDIFPKGKDKSHALRYLEKSKLINAKDMVYFGDKYSEEGNDYAAKIFLERKGGKFYCVNSHEEVRSLINFYED
jgi:phosphomannomutase